MGSLQEQFVNEYPDLYRFALSITRDQARAEDLTHDTIVRGLEGLHQFDGNLEKLGAWLRRILHNLAIDRARQSSHEVVVEDVEAKWHKDDYTVDPEMVAMRVQDTAELEDSLARLPFIYRATVILHDVEGWPVRRIAEVQDIGLSAAKQRLRRGRMALVTALAEGHERRLLLKGVPMPCWDARQHISDYLDGTLKPEIAGIVEEHLKTCPTCPPLYAALVSAHQTMTDLRDPNSVIPPQLDRRLRDLIASSGG